MDLILLLALAFAAGYGLRSYLSYRRRLQRLSRYPFL